MIVTVIAMSLYGSFVYVFRSHIKTDFSINGCSPWRSRYLRL